jgi:hypothetical protein
MYRRTAHRGVAALALVLTLILAGAQPAAAANRPVLDRFASFWGAVINTVPGAHAVLNTLTGWFAKSTDDPPAKTDQGFGMDPNGIALLSQPPQTSPAVQGQN